MAQQNATEDQVARLQRTVAVVGASAGGVEALTNMVRGLPADLPLAFAVVLHMPAGANSHLAQILGRSGPIPAVAAEHGMVPQPGRIYVAPPDNHLVFSGDRMFLFDGPRENGFRPAIDPLFRSAARSFGDRAIGIILSGTMDDGVAGLAAIQSYGGATIVQDPDDALASGMPKAALDVLRPDHVVPAGAMGRILSGISSGEPVDIAGPAHPGGLHAVGSGTERGSEDPTLIADPTELPPHGVDLACPECGGALQGIVAGPMTRFRCRTGHVYSPLTLLDTKAVELEAALWAALRALEEEASMAGRLVARSKAIGADSAASRFENRQADAAQRADLVRQAIHAVGDISQGGPDDTAVSALAPGVAER